MSNTLRFRRLACVTALLCTSVFDSEVELAGVLGRKAVLIVDGGAPQTMGVGQQSREGVKLIDVKDAVAVVEVNGIRQRVALGAAPIRLGEAVSTVGASGTLRLVPDTRGHYWAQGAINGASMRFMVDTGASFVAISAEEAKRAGIDYRAGRHVLMNTANGQSVAWLVALDRVSIGGIVLYGVEASVHEQGLPVALLGMSFVNRLDMRREAGDLVLSKRY